MRLEWIYLVLAVVTEVIASSSLKLSEGFTKIAYAIWSGVGIAAIATIGVVAFREEVTLLRVVSFVLIIAGSVGLSLAGAEG